MGSLMAVCAMARVPFEKWFKFAIRMVAGVYLVGWVVRLHRRGDPVGPILRPRYAIKGTTSSAKRQRRSFLYIKVEFCIVFPLNE